MKTSWKLFTIRGIDIRLHFTFPLILIWAALQFGLLAGNVSSALFGVVAISILFAVVTLHELGHSFAAQYYDVPVKQIVLSPIGGVAQLREMPDKPIQEFVIALAGPAVNFLIAAAMGMMVFALRIDLANPMAMLSGQGGFSLTSLFSYVFVSNILLALFNLLPAFPLDGGRIFRALLAMRLDYTRATAIAAAVGRGTAILLALYALSTGNLFMVFIAVFIFSAAGQEAQFVRYRQALRGYTVQRVFSPSVYRLEPETTLQQAANLLLYSGQRDFPVVVEEQLIGFVSQQDLEEGLRILPRYAPVSAIMRRDVEPVVPADDVFEAQRRLVEARLGALPVVAGGRFLGLLTLRNIADLHRLLAISPDLAPRTQSA
jgi:Zn-dependent protease